MNKIIEDIVEIYRVDSRIELLEGFLDSIPEKKAELAAQIKASENRFEAAIEGFENTKKRLRKKEAELADGEEKIKKIQAKLNRVKTNKEYEAALKEIEGQKEKNSSLEEDILKLFDDVESGQEAVKKIEVESRDEVLETRGREKEMEKKAAAAGEELAERKEKRSQLEADLPPDLVKKYDNIRSARARTVVRADKEICQGCHRHVTAQLYILVLKGEEVIICPNCQRILVHAEIEIDEEI